MAEYHDALRRRNETPSDNPDWWHWNQVAWHLSQIALNQRRATAGFEPLPFRPTLTDEATDGNR